LWFWVGFSGEGMAIDSEKSGADGKVWSLCKMPFWQTSIASSSSSSATTAAAASSATISGQNQSHQAVERSSLHSSNAVSSMAKSLLPTRRRLRLDPSNKLFFPCKISEFFLLSLVYFLFWVYGVFV
jgi:hypothetical protein